MPASHSGMVTSSAPVILARHAVVVAIHLRAWTMLQHVLGVGAGAQLWTACAPTTTELAGGGRCSCWTGGRDDRLRCRCRGRLQYCAQCGALLKYKGASTEYGHHEHDLG
ncbi:hypothetical protein LA05_02805 [Xanthomonas oryzae pv. oryzae]|nr:hypothetical protein LA05_02805 [Xanthomonas oryzae pv. oryzae]